MIDRRLDRYGVIAPAPVRMSNGAEIPDVDARPYFVSRASF